MSILHLKASEIGFPVLRSLPLPVALARDIMSVLTLVRIDGAEYKGEQDTEANTFKIIAGGDSEEWPSVIENSMRRVTKEYSHAVSFDHISTRDQHWLIMEIEILKV